MHRIAKVKSGLSIMQGRMNKFAKVLDVLRIGSDHFQYWENSQSVHELYNTRQYLIFYINNDLFIRIRFCDVSPRYRSRSHDPPSMATPCPNGLKNGVKVDHIKARVLYRLSGFRGDWKMYTNIILLSAQNWPPGRKWHAISMALKKKVLNGTVSSC